MTPPSSPEDDPLHGNALSGLLGLAVGVDAPPQEVEIPDHWAPPTPAHIATLLPQYQIERLIGRGGMGAVYKGRQITLNRPVAIKVLPAELARNTEFVARFHREAQLLASLSHQGIVTIFDFGQTTEGHLYFVMEYVDGTDLNKLIHKQKKRLEPKEALSLTVQICEAMQYAHDKGVVHRDIKPANVLVTTDGRAKLADFGLAMKPADPSHTPEPPKPDAYFKQASPDVAAMRFTQPGAAMGTPDYAAPEVYEGKADERSDIYALGIMLYEMLTGAPPKGYFQLPSVMAPVDHRVDQVVVKALEIDPAARYQKADEMKADVQAATQPLPKAPPAPPAKPPLGAPIRTAPGLPAKPPLARPPARQVSPPSPPKPPVRRRNAAIFVIGAVLLLGVIASVGIYRNTLSTGPMTKALGLTPERKSVQRIEAEALGIVSVTGGKAEPRNDVGGFISAVWSGGSHLWWGNGKKGDTLVLRLPVEEGGRQRIKALFTVARDGGIVDVTLDGKSVPGSPFDLQAEEITLAGTSDWGVFDLSAGDHELKFTLVGTHGSAVALGDSCVGLDFVQLEPLSIVPTSVTVGTDIAPSARPSASNCSGGDHVRNINAGKVPASPSSSHSSRMTWFPRKGGLEWVQYEWETPQVTNECRVVWFADHASAMPMFWRLLYREESGAWVPVAASVPNAVPDQWNVVKFPAVKTTALRISAQCKEEWAAGICHWQVIAADPNSVTDPQLRQHPDLFLGDISPLHSQVGWSIYHVNYVFGNDRKNGAGITVGTTSCDQFIWAHPESRIEFAIPSGYTRFRATGVTANPTVWFLGSWKYRIQVDGETVFESKELNTYKDKQLPMEVVLPPGSRRLTLITDSCGEKNWDGAYWATPVLIADPSITAGAASASAVAKTETSTVSSVDSAKPVSQPIEAGYTSLFDAAHRSGWKYTGSGGLRDDAGAIELSGDGSFYWYERESFSDFILKLDFKVPNQSINAGVFVRVPKVEGHPWDGYEVEIQGDRTGSLPWVKDEIDHPVKLKEGDWNSFEITAVGHQLIILLNGIEINRHKGDKKLAGYIGLQGSGIQFRNVRVKSLSSATSSGPTTDATSARLAEIESQFRAAFDREAEKMVNADLAALDKSLMANGFPQAIADAQRRNAPSDEAALIKERDRFLNTRVMPVEDTPDVHPAVAKLRTKYRDARKAIEGGRKGKPVPPALYEGYLRELTKSSRDSSRLDVAKIKERYQEIAKAAGFETVPLPTNATVEWQSRCGSARREKLLAYGAKPGADAATGRALEFLAARQNTDGSWGSDNRCGVTGLSLLAFLGRCETTESMAYSDVVLKAAMFLIEAGRKNRDGLLSESPASSSAAKEHAIATTALGELYQTGRSGLKTLPGLREVYERAVGLILRNRLHNHTWAGKNGGNGYWERSEPEPPTKDYFTTAWNLQALKIALESDVKDKEITGVFESSGVLWNDFRNTTPQSDGTNPDARMAAAVFGLLYVTENLRVSIGQGTNAIVESVYETKPQWADADLSAWYFTTMAMTLEGSRKWKAWNETTMPTLIASQSSTGSWQRPRAVFSASEVECTALGALMLESCFRIPPRKK